MAIEIRRLIFTHDEAIEAIKAYAAQNGINLPSGKIVRANFAGSPEFEINSLKKFKSETYKAHNIKENNRSIILTIFSEETLEQKYFNLPANFISVALIEYCIKQKIILPKDAQKSLDLSDFNICLDISRNNYTETDTPTNRLTLED